ncbi:MAG: molybdopterin-dependent oxidoreductase, partial [Proteobacteria bacterium]|nr:molybdopterin-dependent oxidoreductase [Pseudomonadota bacterium]
MKRRDFIRLGLLGAGVAGSSSVLGGCGWLAPAGRPAPGTGHVAVTPTYCEMCFWKCAGFVHLEDGQPWKVVGNGSDLHSQGRLCTRGTAGLGSYQDRDRLRTPLLRTKGADGRDTFREATWDEALDVVATRLRTI